MSDLQWLVADRSPKDPEKMLIKRVIGIEGDTVFTRPPYPFKTAVVPVGHVWVEGDDGVHSIDSNTYGPVRTSPRHPLLAADCCAF